MVVTVPVRGLIEENAYIYVDDRTGHGWVIDPGAEPEKFVRTVKEKGWVIEGILLTHGHFDHIGAAEALCREWGVGMAGGQELPRYLADPELNLSAEFGAGFTLTGARTLADGETVSLEADPSFALKVIGTPGHTEDSVIFYSETEGLAFSGDTIFRASIGNYTFPGGDYGTLVDSIVRKVFALPDGTVLWSGHTGPTTVGTEKRRHGFA